MVGLVQIRSYFLLRNAARAWLANPACLGPRLRQIRCRTWGVLPVGLRQRIEMSNLTLPEGAGEMANRFFSVRWHGQRSDLTGGAPTLAKRPSPFSECPGLGSEEMCEGIRDTMGLAD